MWYALILGGILGMLFCYRVSRARKRPDRAIDSWLTVPVLAASAVLVVVCGMTHFSTDHSASRKQSSTTAEHRYYEALGHVLTSETLVKSKRPRGILIVAPKPETEKAAAYLAAFTKGVHAAAKDFPVNEFFRETELADKEDEALERSVTGSRAITVTELESAALKNPEHNVFICMSNIPLDYGGSGFATRSASGDISIGFVLTDVYAFGGDIVTGRVSACAVPIRATSYPDAIVPTNMIDAFNVRYHLLTKGNVERFAQENRRMIHIQRVR